MDLTILLAYCINHSDSFHCILNEDKILKCKEEKKSNYNIKFSNFKT